MRQESGRTGGEGAALSRRHERLGVAALTVSDLEGVGGFYEEVLGFEVLGRNDHEWVLGAGGTPLLLLSELPGARPRPADTTGLFHLAVLLPDRADLARSLRRLIEHGYPLQGASDHLVSEALYLADPDGNGLEISWDRPAETWRWSDGLVEMAVDPLDVESLVKDGDGLRPHLPPGTRLGHVALEVADLRRAEWFYAGLLGFSPTYRPPGAVFVAQDGYHHHVALATWRSFGAPSPPADAVGLRFFTVRVPDLEREAVVARLRDANVRFAAKQQGDALALRDPFANGVVLTAWSSPSVDEALTLAATSLLAP
jgi:catechol 2,3-dioxygenase